MKKYIVEVGGLQVGVEHKRVKNINITIYPPDGRIRVSAPLACSKARICALLIYRMGWIRRKQAELRARPPKPTHLLVDGEGIALFGESLTLQLEEFDGRPGVTRAGGDLIVRTRPGAEVVTRQKLVDDWLRGQLRQELSQLFPKWSQSVGVEVREWRIRKMKTRWGSCNINARRIWINLELVHLAPVYVESVVVHELVHLLEPSHNARFQTLMDIYYPHWRDVRKRLKNGGA